MTMRVEDRMILRQDLEEAGAFVLAAQGILADPSVRLDVSPGSDARGLDELAAFIGFGSDALRGTLTLTAPLSVVRAAYPVPHEGEVALADVLDWAGEVVNLLLGRFTNKLSRRGLTLSASTPKTARALSLAIGSPRRLRLWSLVFSSGAQEARVHLDALASPGRALFPSSPAVETTGIPEGEIQLF
jgi:hypothetical protein